VVASRGQLPRGALLSAFAALADPPNGLNPEKHGGLFDLHQHLHPSAPTP
jgi:hypothetical protein